MAKITVALMRELLASFEREEISFSRMVEMLNEKAAEQDGVWASGFVVCDICTHEWIAVRPAETDRLECPNCGNITTFTTPEDQ